MIIRPVCRKEFVALPNALFNDRRLSADTRAMIALLLSKPRGWELRPRALAKLLSPHGGRPVGWTRVKRMFAEASEAGYMARSAIQAHKDDGTWGKYDYFVGMPEDVKRAVQKAGVAIAPQSRDANEDLAIAENDYTNHKEQSLESTDSRNSKHHQQLPSELGATPKRLSTEERSGRVRLGHGPEIVQHRVALRLGRGDAADGWLIFGALPDAKRDVLAAMERSGHLTEHEVEVVRASVIVASPSATRTV
jgi:hypothetical protein